MTLTQSTSLSANGSGQDEDDDNNEKKKRKPDDKLVFAHNDEDEDEEKPKSKKGNLNTVWQLFFITFSIYQSHLVIKFKFRYNEISKFGTIANNRIFLCCLITIFNNIILVCP